jgi:hypothetical protein
MEAKEVHGAISFDKINPGVKKQIVRKEPGSERFNLFSMRIIFHNQGEE